TYSTPENIPRFSLPSNPDLIRPTIYHPDLHSGNIFIHDGKISSIIDWQSIWAAPLILRENHVRDQGSRSIQLIYEEKTVKANPLLIKDFTQSFGKALSELVSFICGESMGRRHYSPQGVSDQASEYVSRDWSKLATTDPCPYHFTDDDIRKCRQDAAGFDDVQDFWDISDGKVDRSGWTTNQDSGDAVDYVLRLREAGLGKLVGEERREFELETRWVLEHKQ
ncbi:hypothetical protein ACJ73_02587, partial [Blastomyces percursus]